MEYLQRRDFRERPIPTQEADLPKTRKQRRIENRKKEEFSSTLTRLLSGFYDFLGQKNKPSDQEVRDEFTNRNGRWMQYCAKNHMMPKAYQLFKDNVREAWYHEKKAEK